MNGVLPIDKPAGFTSFDVIAKLRGILKERRLGHSGTLDPMATGVLPVFVGSATKAADILPDAKKRYEAEFVLGYSTDTQDTTGSVIAKSGVKVSEAEVKSAVLKFSGEIFQTPPMYSAIKVGGKRLYDLARQGKTVERPSRKITVYNIKLLSFDPEAQTGRLAVECSKGTYIRTLINDIGENLGSLGAMSALKRTYSQGFDISSCVDIGTVQYAADSGRISELLIPVENCFKSLPRITLSNKQEKMYKNGVRLEAARVGGASRDGLFTAYGETGFLGLCKVSDGEIKVYKNFWSDSLK